MSIAMEDWPRRHRITVDEYHRMAEGGSFAPDARVELIDGEIIDMPPIGSRHMAHVDRLNELLRDAVGRRAIVRCQGSVQLGDTSEPQPDFALLVRREDFYESRRANAGDVLLVIEVSDSTLGYDTQRKMALYARHGIQEYWVVDVENRLLHVHQRPTSAGYEQTSSIDAPGTLNIAALPGITVDLSSIFGAGAHL
jgi:Uma2 family endonuclease